MKAFKSASASVKETVQNVKAKEEERGELSKAAAQIKVERKNAENRAGKHDAESNFHSRQAEIIRGYEQKKAENKSVKEQTKAALHQPKADKKAAKEDKKAAKEAEKAAKKAEKNGAPVGDEEQASPTPPSDTQTEPTGETLDDRDTSTPASADNPEPASEERGEGTDSNAPTSDGADSPPGDDSELPMHGSGVPTHSEVHSDGKDKHDLNTTQTMGGSPNNESYM